MSNQAFQYDFNQLRLPPQSRRWWPKALAICAVLGGIYGAALGSAIGAVLPSLHVIVAAAAILAVICGPIGARAGFFLDVVRQVRYGRLFTGTVATIGGAILGGFLATMVLLALGAIPGTVGGWLLVRAVMALRHGVVRRFLGGIAGAVLGMFLGATLWAVRINQAPALTDAAWGLGIGIIVGPLLLLLFIGTLRSLPAARRRDDGSIVDTTFQK
jgi:hypothetical protein